MSKVGSYKIDEIQNKSDELKRLEMQSQMMKPLEMKILKESGLLPTHSVLEFGCGPGYITPILCEIAKQGQVIAVDNDEKLLEICRQRVTEHPQNGFSVINNSQPGSLTKLNSQIDFSYLRFVLQHVPDKEAIIQEVFKTLKPGGMICTLDSDDGLVVQYPEDEFIQSILSEAQSVQALKGGDRLVGRKIPSLLAKHGFSKIQSRVLSFTNKDIPFSLLASILFGFKSDLVGKRKEMEAWIKKTDPLVRSGHFFLTGGVILTTAERP